MTDRTPYNGRQYYCIKCGLSFGEFIACELPDCTLESWSEAQRRAQLHKADKELEAEIDRG